MRIYRRAAFLKLPPGTIYAKGMPWVFDGIEVKGDTIGDDWSCLSLIWIESNDDADHWAKLDDMLERGDSVPMQSSYSRDGCFDKDALFLVAERDDLLKMRDMIDAAIAVSEAAHGFR